MPTIDENLLIPGLTIPLDDSSEADEPEVAYWLNDILMTNSGTTAVVGYLSDPLIVGCKTPIEGLDSWSNLVVFKSPAIRCYRFNSIPYGHVEIIQQSTETQISNPVEHLVERTVKGLLIDAEDLLFEEGVQTSFSKGLMSLVKKYRQIAIEYLDGLFKDNLVKTEIIAESLRWMGEMDDLSTFEARLSMLVYYLKSSSFIVREGAILGLGSLESSKAIPSLEEALASEKNSYLKRDIQDILDHLKS